MNNKIAAAAFGAALFMLLTGGTSIITGGGDTQDGLYDHAERVLASCREERYRPSCYDKEIPRLMPRLSMEEAFEVTVIVQERDREYQYCHVLGHELSAIEVRKDPTNWKDVVSRCPSGICSNGCIHGGFQEKFRTESFSNQADIENIKPDLEIICENRINWNPTGMEQATCYHALGHLTMYITNANINASIELCKEISVKEGGARDMSALCFDGAFMQIFQPLEPEDFALVDGKQPTKENASAFCNLFRDSERASCINESWPLYYEGLISPEGISSFCERQEHKYKGRCYNAMFYIAAAQMNLDTEKVSTFCSSMPSEILPTCFANGASRMIEVDYKNAEKAISLCNTSEQYDKTHACFEEMLKYSTFNYHPASKEFINFCNMMPQKWQHRCLAR